LTGVVHAVLPNDIDDPAAPSGGNVYDRRVIDGLASVGWVVREHSARGAWPSPSDLELAGLAALLGALPDDALVLIDGLIVSAAPEALQKQAARLRMVALVHMPLGDERERRALACARAIIVTSEWTRSRLPEGGVHVVTPGVGAAPLAPGTADGHSLICVAAITPVKGIDRLVAALPEALRCVCVGSLARDPAYVAAVRRQIAESGADVVLAGPLFGASLDRAYAAADLLVLPTRAETYGMVVTEALARGLPVVATAVGGVPESMGTAADGSVPGMLVPPEDQSALELALRRWRDEPQLRQRLRRSAVARRAQLTGWNVTVARLAAVLRGVAA
jgi:glycosyltransferase involved in cell wall biosynthesis